jgi:hypothetical protein
MIAAEGDVRFEDRSAEFASPPSRKKLGLAVGLLVLSAMLSFLPLVPYRTTFTLTAVLIGILVGYVNLRRRAGPFDFFEIYISYGVLYVIYFGVGAIFLSFNPQFLPSLSLFPYLEPALALGVVGFLAFTAGYALLGNRVKPSPSGRYRPRGIISIAVPGLAGCAAQLSGAYNARLVRLGGFSNYVAAAFGQLGPFFLLAWFLVWYCVWAKFLSLAQRIVLVALFVPMCAAVIYSTMGQKALTIILLLVPAVAFWYVRRRLPAKTIVAVFVVGIFVIFPAYNTFRGQNDALSIPDRLDRTVKDASGWDSRQVMDKTVLAFIGRLSLVFAPAAVIRDAGTRVEYKYGETLFLTPVAVFVPRFIWPERPALLDGHEFGRTFGLISRTDRATQIASTAVAEFYWNFHVPGVVVGMFLLGGAYKWLYKKYGEGGSGDPFRKAAYLLFLVVVVHGEGSIAGWAAGLIKTFIIVNLLFAFYRRLGLVDVVAPEGELPASA